MDASALPCAQSCPLYGVPARDPDRITNAALTSLKDRKERVFREGGRHSPLHPHAFLTCRAVFLVFGG